MKINDKFYDSKVVTKPWGYEHVVYRDKKLLCITLLKIDYKKTTSLHCHPEKKSGFILLKGKALFQLGLWKKRSEIHISPSKRMIARGLFHSIKSISREGLLALEFETQLIKMIWLDLKTHTDDNKSLMKEKNIQKNITNSFIKFKKPIVGKKQIYSIGNTTLSVEVHKNFSLLLKNKPNTIFAILKGSIVDKNKGK